MNKGKLYIVSTPIGNLGDITYRAIETLKDVAFVLAEDTRESTKLLKRYDIDTQLVSYRDQNHNRMIEKIKEKLDMGLDLALISDNGTPLISDPGFKLVRELRKKCYIIESIPGPSALIAALSISGLPTDKFSFLGFLPKSEKKRIELLNKYIFLNTTVIYESPKRVFSLLKQIYEVSKEIYVVLAKDLTKKREEVIEGNILEVIEVLNERGYSSDPHGEFVVITNFQKE